MHNLEGLTLKILGGLSLGWKMFIDVREAASFADYLTLEKAGVTGLLLFFLWFFMNAYKETRKKADQIALEKEIMLKELAEEKAKNAVLSERINRQDDQIKELFKR